MDALEVSEAGGVYNRCSGSRIALGFSQYTNKFMKAVSSLRLRKIRLV
jgi:hypothetical protein